MLFRSPHDCTIAHGLSLGAHHAANIAFRHPRLFRKLAAFSGRYDLTRAVEHFSDLMSGHYDDRVYFHMPNHYLDRAKKRTAHKDIATDTDPARPMRAPGHPQGFFGAELFLDELATLHGLDPLDVRRRNDNQALRLAQYDLGAETFRWAATRNPKPGTPMAGDDARYLRGVGMASARWGALGSPGGRTPHAALCRIHQDGSVETRNGAQDVGVGNKTMMAVVTAEELGIPVAAVKAVMGHTTDPSGPASGGSKIGRAHV